MTNTDHVDKFNEGPAAWNQWRRENSAIAPKISGGSLDWKLGTEVEQYDLAGVKLVHEDLENTLAEKIAHAEAVVEQAELSERVKARRPCRHFRSVWSMPMSELASKTLRMRKRQSSINAGRCGRSCSAGTKKEFGPH